VKHATFVLFVALACPVLGADEILQESFPASRYGTVEAPLQATGGEEGGFVSSWRQEHIGEGRSGEMALYVPEGLEYTDSTGQRLKVEGGAARILQGPGKPATLRVERPIDCSSGGALAGFSSAGTAIDQGTVYVSYLIQAGVMNAPYQMLLSLKAGTVGAEDGVRLGFVNTRRFQVQRVKNREGLGSIEQPLPGDFPMLVVLRIVFPKDGKPAEIALWLNPTLGEERDPDNVLFLEGNDFSFRSIGLHNLVGAMAPESNVVFDEIRIGPTFASVTPKG